MLQALRARRISREGPLMQPDELKGRESVYHEESTFPDVLILASALSAASLGLCALLGWLLDLPLLATFGAGLIPMAPSTALLFLLFGLVLFFTIRIPHSRLVRILGLWVAFTGGAAALALFVLSSFGIYLLFEHLGMAISGMIGGVLIGHMSPVTAFFFVALAVSLLGVMSPEWQPRQALATAASAAIVILASSAFILAYLFGAPLLYGGGFIPPALPTLLAFFLLSAGILVRSLHERLLPRGREDASTRRVTYVIALTFTLLAAGIVTTGYYYYRDHEKTYRAEIEQQLAAISSLKVADIVQWRKERLGDALIFHNNPNFSRLIAQYLQSQENGDARSRILMWMLKVQKAFNYDRICLLDAKLVERLSYPIGREPLDSMFLKSAVLAGRSGEIVFQDFYRGQHDGRVHLNLHIPIFDEQRSRVLAILSMRIDPNVFLYPLIRRWPTSSRTAETLLIRREGEDVLFLNELRFKQDAALNLRSSLSNRKMPAVRAATGEEGIVEGVDYRETPVLAHVRPIPDSPWFLVARMDLSEVYSPLREQMWITVFLIGALLLCAGAGVGWVWRQQRIRFLQERLESTDRIRKLNRVYAVLSEINQTIVRIHEPQALFEQGCRMAVEKGNFLLAWIALIDASTQRFRTAAFATQPHLPHSTIHDVLSSNQEIHARVHEALQMGEHVVTNALEQGDPPVAFHDAAVGFGARSAASFPLRVSGALKGAMILYAAEPHFFDEEELKLLDELATDISFAMEFMKQEEDRKKAEQEALEASQLLRQSEQRFRTLFEEMFSGLALHEIICDEKGTPVDYRFLAVNTAFERLTGLKSADIIGRRVLEVLPKLEHSWIERYGRVALTGNSETFTDHSAELGKYYEVRAYSPLRGQFATVFQDVTTQVTAEQDRRRYTEQLKGLATHLQKAREEERTQVSREIHDELGQQLTALKMDLSLAQRSLHQDSKGKDEIIKELEAIKSLVDRTIVTVRKLSSRLRPDVLDKLEFPDAVRWLSEEFQHRYGIPCSLSIGQGLNQVKDPLSTEIFRLIQEAMTNVARHAEASSLDLTLAGEDRRCSIEVRDNGKGMNQEQLQNPSGLGIIGMRERVVALGGKFSILSSPGNGTTIRAEIQLP